MKISVIIPTLNEAGLISNLVHFILKYGKEKIIDVIVVDGGSTDNTVAHAKQACARVIISEKQSRPYQMNIGANIAKGEILYFLHADVKPVESFVDDIFQAFADGYDAGCYRFKLDSSRFMLKVNSYCTRFNGIMCRGGDQTLFISKKLFYQLNGFDEFYIIMEDFDLILRIRKNSPFKIMPKSVLVSARKYENKSWLRVQGANFIIFMMFFMKRHPLKMKEAYKKMLEYPYN